MLVELLTFTFFAELSLIRTNCMWLCWDKASVRLYVNNRRWCHSCQVRRVIAFFLVIWIWHPIFNNDSIVIALRSHGWAFEWYQNTSRPPHPPHSTQHPVYLHWSAITDAFRSLNHEPHLELLHRCQTHHRVFFCSMAPHEQGLLFCVIKETHIECAEMHINFQIILFRVWFDAYKYRAPSGESQDNFSFLQI